MMKWCPIEDLPIDWEQMKNDEIPRLFEIWKEQVTRLKETEALKRFNEKLKRRWAIETGIIERIYDIDRGITEILIEQGINAALIPHGSTDKPAEEMVLSRILCKFVPEHRKPLFHKVNRSISPTTLHFQ